MNKWKTAGLAIALLAITGAFVYDLWPKAVDAIEAPKPVTAHGGVIQFEPSDL